jgi:hypothetical protein
MKRGLRSNALIVSAHVTSYLMITLLSTYGLVIRGRVNRGTIKRPLVERGLATYPLQVIFRETRIVRFEENDPGRRYEGDSRGGTF